MFYPIMVDLEAMNILIVGGGRLAYRKASYLKDYNKRARIVAIDFHPSFIEDSYEYDLVSKAFEFKDLEGVDMVYVATDDRLLNAKITEYCKKNRILVNNLDNSNMSSFINTGNFTLDVDKSKVMVAVSTFGKDCGLTKKIRNKIREMLE